MIINLSEFNGIWTLNDDEHNFKDFISWQNALIFLINNYNSEEELDKLVLCYHNIKSNQFYQLANLTEYISGKDEQPIFWHLNVNDINFEGLM